ncbi:MAG: trypsin-like peptidase domain-containing protein [Actinobacteria bacterium]|nr:trypsin-like peptidase domain-containing protein [Actinomycetota bacterium]
MRAAAVAAIATVAAVLGGSTVVLVAAAAGWLGGERTQTVVVPAAIPSSRPAPVAVRSTAKPLAGNSFDPARIYAARSPGVVTVYTLFGDHGSLEDQAASGQGSGFVVSADGHVLTNAHVITNAGDDVKPSDVVAASRVYVQFEDGERVRAEIVGWDLFDDVGVIRVAPSQHSLSPVPLGDSAAVRVGEPVAVIGSPFDEQNSLAVGVVSATERSIEALTSDYALIDAIQIDAPINRGNSGGPLFDARGRVIGINAQIRSQSGTAEGVGFAVPINSAKRSLRQLIARGRVAYAYVGVVTDDLTPALADRLKLQASNGALVVRVTEGGPAAKAGLRGGSETIELSGREFRTGGDVVLAIDGERVGDGDDLVRVVSQRLEPGQVATFTVLRDGRRVNVPVRLSERPLDIPNG